MKNICRENEKKVKDMKVCKANYSKTKSQQKNNLKN